MPRLLRRLAALVAVVLAVVVALPAVASAHGGPGVIEVDEPEARGDLSIGLRIRISYEDDGHTPDAADVGEISVEGTGPGGDTVGPETGFEPTEVPGVYAVELTFPEAGSWDLTITSTEPEATQTTTVEVGAPDADAGSSDGTGDEPTTDGTADDNSDMTVSSGEASIVERGSGGDGPTPLLVTLLVAAVLVVGGVAGALVLRRRGRST